MMVIAQTSTCIQKDLQNNGDEKTRALPKPQQNLAIALAIAEAQLTRVRWHF